ncbi:MAG: DUF2336 domain-containing protein [Rhodospirillales bacterium]|jgi:uncharacterized protein (DUF2336 family)|nr:DUF2336 domain-containing protein [Rhodospirillales bacterium]
MLSWVFGNAGKSKRGRRRARARKKKPSYKKARAIAANGKLDERAELASHEDLEPEILYYFASDEAPEVRREVAENVGTPLQADKILALDVDEEVRFELARKIGRLVLQLPADENERLAQMAMDVLQILAQDDLPRVRATIAEELKRAANVPSEIVQKLARDVEEIVSAPIIEYSPLLSDQDLLGIIEGGIAGAKLVAAARRPTLTEPVSDAVAKTQDVDAVAALLENETASISEPTIDMIAVEAEGVKEWHAPMALRENLPLRTIRRVATFVSAALVDKLIERNELEPESVDDLRMAVRRRIEAGELTEEVTEHRPAEDRAREMYEAGTLTEEAMIEALDERDNAFVRHGLVLMSGLPADTVQKMINTGAGKGITCLSWKAGVNMTMAETLQRRLGRVPPQQMMRAAQDDKYPLTEGDIQWYLSFYE